MFTGLVQARGEIVALIDEPAGKRLVVRVPGERDAPAPGASVAINGCCLTVVNVEGERLSFEAGPETLARTNLGRLTVGSHVNVERSLRAGDELGGHYVTGHVDCLGKLDERKVEGEFARFWFRIPPERMPEIVAQGSIAVDGVSLTVVSLDDDRFSVMLIPHTLAATTLGQLQPGDAVNLETDMIAKYVRRQLGKVAWMGGA